MTENLYNLKEIFRMEPTHANYTNFIAHFAEQVKNGDWMSMPCFAGETPNSYRFLIKEMRGGKYIAIYSGVEGRALGDSPNTMNIDIRRVIETLYENPRLSGIVFDPNKNPYCVHRKDLDSVLDMKDPRLKVRYWGKGIPNYNENDLLVSEELLDFAIEIAENNVIKNKGYTVVEKNVGLVGFPNIAFKRGEELVFAKVDYSTTPYEPVATEDEKNFYRTHAAKFNAKCLYIPIIIQSNDAERAARGILLCGDCFDCRIGAVVSI